jgi:hypothetical protein
MIRLNIERLHTINSDKAPLGDPKDRKVKRLELVGAVRRQEAEHGFIVDAQLVMKSTPMCGAVVKDQCYRTLI